ncbi:DUF1501 domain-containing protein [Tuwongella immobilis]|uniref:DUF1501 domain-containing protein n=1 Tax=Tuwongella immobilis TaxID=692036 RepID=A0A6C2YIB6_9BACT|nr:DUF1501 domain-containing protein [Tuwongella immobilis]VIP00883.1 hypothetical protein : Uncharacterized protein OS=Planctomyces maris DSM 8797 GN=PM8797T_20998 PE=4 SV=1: DUF1501 [Tuwongella immobilis]VTR97184.1 hypothetical protein : Uncharacterized protein OS=Planctomyces maris DSM 8797 GN=PM8797T_20998 PE=4 SV=1: DUF1501 [Tuwongella immobilis]
MSFANPASASLRHRPLSRRNFLQIGSLGLGGLTLPNLLRAESTAGVRSSQKSVILIYLVGGPPHQDMFDLKPDAPKEIAGPWKPIQTNVTGIQICEAFPRLAQLMDKMVIVRSLVGNQADHDAIQVYNGFDPRKPKPSGGWPQFGSAVAKLQGPVDPSVPPFISLCYTCTHGPYNEPGPGYLGASYSPFRPMGPAQKDMMLNGVTVSQLADRKNLLRSFDSIRREVDTNGMLRGMDTFNEQAFGLLTSSKLAEAMDLSREPDKIVKRYGTGNPKIHMDENGAPRVPQSLLMARRLIEAGARVVTLNYSKWDWHGGANNSIFKREAEDFPVFDQCVSALVEDLHNRGLDKDCTVIVMGEFGRTPKISDQVGRDHWPQVNCALMFGGGMTTGQVIGATDKQAGMATARPVTFGELFATLYHNLGIDPMQTTITDLNGRPQFLVADQAAPMRELIG